MVRDARMRTQTQARFLVPLLDDASLVPGDRQDYFDGLIRARVMAPFCVQVKIWAQSEALVDVNDQALIGRRFELSDAELATVAPRGERQRPAT